MGFIARTLLGGHRRKRLLERVAFRNSRFEIDDGGLEVGSEAIPLRTEGRTAPARPKPTNDPAQTESEQENCQNLYRCARHHQRNIERTILF